MTNFVKAFALALTVFATSQAMVSTASAQPDAYGWAYPDQFKGNR